jgi:hypothetical protein
MCTICRSYSSLTPACPLFSLDRDDLNLHLVGTIGCSVVYQPPGGSIAYPDPSHSVHSSTSGYIRPRTVVQPGDTYTTNLPTQHEDDGAARGSSILSFKYVI